MPTVTITQNTPPDSYASFTTDLNFYKRDGSIVTPSGSPIATLDGLGVCVDEATTNLWTGGFTVYNNLSIPATLTMLGEDLFGELIYRLTMTPTTQAQVDSLKANFWNHGVYGSSRSYTANTKYSASIYWRKVDKDVEVGGGASNIAGWGTTTTVDANDGWKRSDVPWTGATTGTDQKYWSFKCPSLVLGQSVSIDFTCPMIESGRDYPTSYVKGSRSQGVISYPSTILNTNNWTIVFTADIQRLSPNWRMFFMPWTYMYFGISPNSTNLVFSYVDGTQKSITIPSTLGKHTFVLTYDYSIKKLRIFMDGTEVSNSTVNLIPTQLTQFDIGNGNGHSYSATNIVMSHYMIFDRVIKDAEIQTITNQGTYYLWKNSGFNWTSADATKGWASQYFITYFLDIVEDTITITETPKKTPKPLWKETFSVSDKLTKDAIKVLTENLIISDTYIDLIDFILRVYENITITETPKKTVKVVKKETLKVEEMGSRDIGHNEFESFSIADMNSNSIEILKKETLGFAEKCPKSVTALKKEAFTITETKQPKEVSQLIKENINIAEMYSDLIGFYLKIIESINLEEKLAKDSNILKKESLGITDKRLNAITKVAKETVGFTEVWKDTVSFNRVFQETIGIVDKLVKNYGLNKFEAVKVVDAYLRSANAIMSDIYFSGDELTLENFQASVDTPLGYEPFKDFIAGDLHYQKALLRLIVEAEITGGRPFIDQFAFNVDVPDARDFGSATISASNTRIEFNRRFYAPPEISITLRGGTRGIPCVTNVDETGFYVEIVDAQNNFIAGSFSWTAVGY